VGALERAGLGDLPWSANRVRIEGRRAIPEFPYAADSCGSCGSCKGARVRAHRARGRTVVFVGDGLSDRCGARAADRVHARSSLLRWCRENGIAAEPFAGFADLTRRYEGPVDRLAAAAGGAGC
jgi:2-hydroxy-3-keto-5-methylthiopentenyl-1-phosphate phosphatase